MTAEDISIKLVSHWDASKWRLFRDLYEIRFGDRNATLQQFSHCCHPKWVIKTHLQQSHECRTLIVGIIGECCTTFSRHSCNIRKTLALCSPDKIANIYYHQTPHDVLTNAKVVQKSHDGLARNDKPSKINILASIETSD